MGNHQTNHDTLESINESFENEYLPMIISIAKRVSIMQNFIDMNDLISLGTEGLICSAKNFIPSKKCSFKTYAFYRIKGRMMDYIIKECKVKKRTLSEEHLDNFCSDWPQYDRDDSLIESITITLDGIEQIIIDMIYIHQFNQVEISKKIGLSKSKVCRIHKNALKKMKNSIDH